MCLERGLVGQVAGSVTAVRWFPEFLRAPDVRLSDCRSRSTLRCVIEVVPRRGVDHQPHTPKRRKRLRTSNKGRNCRCGLIMRRSTSATWASDRWTSSSSFAPYSKMAPAAAVCMWSGNPRNTFTASSRILLIHHQYTVPIRGCELRFLMDARHAGRWPRSPTELAPIYPSWEPQSCRFLRMRAAAWRTLHGRSTE